MHVSCSLVPATTSKVESQAKTKKECSRELRFRTLLESHLQDSYQMILKDWAEHFFLSCVLH